MTLPLRIDRVRQLNLPHEQGLNLPPDQFSVAMQFANPSEIIEYLDHKFELTLLYGKDGNFIKVVD